jgi:hypothetical protein
MLFDTLNDIIYYKTEKQLDIPENEQEYSAYMINRWLSMHSGNYSVIVNETVNKYYGNFTTKKDHYKFLCKVLPKDKIKRVEYLKKDKATKVDKTPIKFLAKNLELSEREVTQYIECNNIDIKELATKLKQYEQKG